MTTTNTARLAPAKSISIAEVIAANTLILELHVRGPMFKKGVSSERILDRNNGNAGDDEGNGKINPDYVHISKDLIDQKQLKRVRDLTSQFQTKLKFFTLPTGMLAPGLYRVSTKGNSIDQVDALIEEFKAARAAELQKFAANYPELIAQAEKDLGPEFNRADYPPIESVLASYRVDVNYFSADVPASLEEISRTVYEREIQKRDVQLQSAYDDIQTGLRVGFASLVDTFARQLGTDAATGKKRKLYDSTLEKVNLFLQTFSSRNMTNDQDLARLVQQAQDLVNGKDTKAIKGSDPLRSALQAGFDKINSTVSTMVEVKSRKFSLQSDV